MANATAAVPAGFNSATWQDHVETRQATGQTPLNGRVLQFGHVAGPRGDPVQPVYAGGCHQCFNSATWQDHVETLAPRRKDHQPAMASIRPRGRTTWRRKGQLRGAVAGVGASIRPRGR